MKSVSFAALLLALAVSSRGADWPCWRGPAHDDISKETGLLKAWPEDGPKQFWVNENVGLGYSGYAIVGNVLYTMGAFDAVEYVLALDVKTGKELWRTEAGPLLSNGNGDGPRSTPSVEGGKVYAISGKGTLVCMNATDGKALWDVSLTELDGKVPGWGYTESPLLDGNMVVCTPGGPKGTMAAFDKVSGKLVWQSAEWTDPAQYASILPVDHNGTRQLIQLTMQSVAAVNAADGKLLWKAPFPGVTAVCPTPIFDQGRVFVAAGYNVGCKMVSIGEGNEVKDGYMNKDMVNHHGGVVLYQGYLYGYSDRGGWTCMDFATGEVKWQEKKALGKGAIHCADGQLYLLEESSGTVALIDASPAGWQEHGRFKLAPQTEHRSKNGRIWTHPTVCNGRLYLRDQDKLLCYGVSSVVP